MSFTDRDAAIRRGERVLIDGPHHSQRRTIKRFRREFPGLVERHVDALTGAEVDTYDESVNTAGTATWVYLPPAPPNAAGTATP